MADRFWVGGTGTWNTTSTTNWSATSGGGGGASVPTAADSVFFNQTGFYTVTMTGGLNCLDITVSAGNVTFATGASPTLSIAGSMTLLAGTVWSSTAGIIFTSSTMGRTVTTNGVALGGSVRFNGTGGWTLGSGLTSTNLTTGIQFLAGTFDTSSTGNFPITSAAIMTFNSTLARTVNFNASTITLSVNSNSAFSATTIQNLTFNAGTSQINLTAASAGISSAGLTFANVAFTSTSPNSTRPITGTNTFNNLAITGPGSGIATITFAAQQTINGTLSTNGTTGNSRVFFTSNTYGISQDLIVNGVPNLTDADFRGLYVRGTAAPISGTRIGDRGECLGIAFSAPKNVFMVNNAGGAIQWTSNIWALSANGAVFVNNFPLPQDTAIIGEAGIGSSTTVQITSSTPYLPTINSSTRTSAFGIQLSANTIVYGSWTNGPGVSLSGSSQLTFSGGKVQTITSAGKIFANAIVVDTYGGTVLLNDALNLATSTLTVTNGTFDTGGYAANFGLLSSSNSNVRTINLGASTVTLNGNSSVITFTNNTNLTFNAGTSTINAGPDFGGNLKIIDGGNSSTTGVSFYTVRIEGGTVNPNQILGANRFHNLILATPATDGPFHNDFFANQIITGTLTCVGPSPIRRVSARSSAVGTQRTLTVNTLSATNCDFRDINVVGAASGASATGASDCGGNSGITFPAPKTVYWNLAGARNWSATAWATQSGGTPAINNFPLAQDTAVFDNAGSVTDVITIESPWSIGTFDASLRTNAMTLTIATLNSPQPVIYGDWKFGTGVTWSGLGTIIFSKNGTQTITSNGVPFGCNVSINRFNANVQLADAITLNPTSVLTLTSGSFNAGIYNVTTGRFVNSSTANTLRMGSGTWTISGTSSTIWGCNQTPIMFAGTSTIVLSGTGTTLRTFDGGSGYYNKLTIGGSTGTSSLSLFGSSVFGELASIKTVAHTITFQNSATVTVGKWSVTGTLGNVVTINTNAAGALFTLFIAGPGNSGINYLSIRDCELALFSPGEFYVGANSTNVSNNTRLTFTAAPAPRTLYWVGGTGNWSDTARWSTTSGGGGGAAIPTSLDTVIFNSASNATAYTATIDGGVTHARCASFTMAGPASGNVTFAGGIIAFHGNVSFAATGVVSTLSSLIYFAGNSNYTLNTNGLPLSTTCTISGLGSSWTLGSPFSSTGPLNIIHGSFSTSSSNHALTVSGLSAADNPFSLRALSLNNSSINLNATTAVQFGELPTANFSFSAGASTISTTNANSIFNGNNQTFHNVILTVTAVNSTVNIRGQNFFNNLSIAGTTTLRGVRNFIFHNNQTVNGILSISGGDSVRRTRIRSGNFGTPVTLTAASFAAGATDVDFQDIVIAGAAAPISGTRFGNGRGNTGITFPAPKTVYFSGTGSFNDWGATVAGGSWSDTVGGVPAQTHFPLIQDTAVFPASYPPSGATVTFNESYSIGTIDMSARTSNTMTLSMPSYSPIVHGNWINGTGITLSGINTINFSGRGNQTIRSAGKQFSSSIAINSPGGTVTLEDALTVNGTFLILTNGTFNLAGYTATVFEFESSNTNTRVLNFGTNGVLSCYGWTVTDPTNLTVTGTGTISLANPSSKTFTGGNVSYTNITLNNSGAGSLTISGNNTFKTITNSYSATGASQISFTNGSTQTFTDRWLATGQAGRVLALTVGTTCNLRFTGPEVAANVDYLSISNIRAYPLSNSWYRGSNSTTTGLLGWVSTAASTIPPALSSFFISL
jgi:hypothetical protein